METTARVLGSVAGQLVGPTTLKNIAEPIKSESDKSQQINQKSAELDSIIKFGAMDARKKAITNPASPAAALKAANPSATISVIDPNWYGLGDPKNTLHKYLANFKMAS
jgi:hypothetical protein